MGNLERLKKHKTIPFLNISTSDKASWARIGRSTVFDLVLNAQTEDNNFIEDEMATTELMSYKPELAQELQCNKGDPAFDFLYDMFFNLPTGEDVKKNLLIVFAGNIGTEDSQKFRAWDTTCTLIIDHFDSVAEKIYFKFNIIAIKRGTATVADNTPAFTEGETPPNGTSPGGESSGGTSPGGTSPEGGSSGSTPEASAQAGGVSPNKK